MSMQSALQRFEPKKPKRLGLFRLNRFVSGSETLRFKSRVFRDKVSKT